MLNPHLCLPEVYVVSLPHPPITLALLCIGSTLILLGHFLEVLFHDTQTYIFEEIYTLKISRIFYKFQLIAVFVDDL